MILRVLFGDVRRLCTAGMDVVAGALLVACLSGLLAAQEPAAQGPAETQVADMQPATPEQVARWIQELDDSLFVTRRNATERLIESGHIAVGPVTRALAHSNLEVATRGIYVLRALAMSQDVAAQDAAAESLQELMNSPVRAIARQATDAMAALEEVRQQKAITELENLGAKIFVDQRVTVFAPVVGLSVEIGPEWQGTVQDLQRFRWLPDVQAVSFMGQQITDEWMSSLEHLANVERILIKNANISNEAVKSISKLKRVTRVDLMYSPVNDTAIDYLQDMKTVRDVRLYGTDITREAVERYQAVAPQVVIDFKMGAFLGVMCQPAPLPCHVVEVVPASAAALGGVEVHDIIVRYGGHPVANFEELRKLIAKNKVGDSVLIQVARGGTPLVAVVPRRGDLALGLEAEPAGCGCQVKKLASDGAAAKAGMRVDDVIMDLNGEPVTTLEELTRVFTPLPATARLEFTVLRNGQIKSVRVTFGEWTESAR